MASVAAAIEEASVFKADEDLWWESHTQLFQLLDKSISSDGGQFSDRSRRDISDYDTEQQFGKDTILAEKLKNSHRWLLQLFRRFKPPSASSKAALNSPRVAVGKCILEIKAHTRDLALRVSTILVLDEIQAYILSNRLCESRVVCSPPDESVLLSSIVMSFYMEKQSLLKSLRLLLTCQMAEEDSSARLSQAISDEVKKLLEDGLEDKLLESLKDSLSSAQPQHLDRQYADLWAEEAALEQTLLLDNVFLLYYEPLCVCKFTRLKELIILFEGLTVGGSKNEILALTPEVEKSVRHARRQAVLIIIEVLDLESLLLMLHSETPFSQGGCALSVDELLQLDAVMAGLDLDRAPEYSPVLLSWAIFLCLVSFLPLNDGQTGLSEVDHTAYVKQAYDAGAYNFLVDMLRDDYFQEFDIQVGGYKSVIKTLMAAFLAAYDFASQMTIDGHDILVDILCELYRGQEALCLELWDRDSVIDGPIRSLLFSLWDSFPYQTSSLVRLLGAQCEGTWPAECVYDFLYKMVDITCLYQRHELSLTNESGTMVQTPVTLQVPDAPGLLIPAGSSGSILRELDGGVCLVRWECKHSGIVVLLLRMLQRSSVSYQFEEVLATVDLINRMLTCNKVLTQLLLDLDGASATVGARRDGRMESSLRLDVVSMICCVINGLVQNSGDDKMVASCIGILTSFALCCPERVMMELGQSILLQPSGSYLSFSDGGAFPGTLLHELIVKTEQSCGRYPLTIAVLDFCNTMVEKGVVADSLASLLLHVVGNLFVNHSHWKYQQWHERWIITTKVLSILRTVLTGIIRSKEVSNLKGVLELLLYDCIIHDALISILSVNAQELEELHYNRAVGVKEIEWLQQAIFSVLMLLHDLVLDVSSGVCSKEYGGTTLLEQTLFRKTAGSLPVVTAIASFLGFSRNGDLQFASAKALTSLFLLAQKSRTHPFSIANYISSNDQKLVMRSAIGDLLSEETAISNCSLFEAVIDLLTAAVRWQPALVEQLLFPMEQYEVLERSSDKESAKIANFKSAARPEWFSEGLDALWKFVTNSAALGKSHPRVLARVLFLLAAIWEGGTDYMRIIEALRSRNQFWRHLTGCLSFTNAAASDTPTLLSKIMVTVDPETSITSSISKDKLVEFSFRYSCEASVFSIMARDIFLQQHLVQTGVLGVKNGALAGSVEDNKDDVGGGTAQTSSGTTKSKQAIEASGAQQVVTEWCRAFQMSAIMRSYAHSLYDKSVLLRAKAEARLLIVGLMGKILSGDCRGLNAALARRIRDAAKQISQHPSLEELSEEYSTRGYSYGERLQVMLVNDLFHHLQGELDGGRPIPSGSFQHVADFLVSNEVDLLLQPTVSTKLPDLHPCYGDTFIYDTVALEAELGLEWWATADFGVVTAYVAESTSKWLQSSNAMACLGDSQLSALKSWTTLLSVTVFNKLEAHSLSEIDWTDATLKSYNTELCDALEGILSSIGQSGDTSNLTPNFMTSQVQLVLVFIRWLSCLGKPSMQVSVWGICAHLSRTVVNCLRKLLDARCFLPQQTTDLLKPLLGGLLLILELMQSQKSILDSKQGSSVIEDKEAGDAFADVTLVGLGFLPSLCHAAEKSEFANISLAIINAFMKNFLAPSTWFPVLQDHFPLGVSLSRMHEDPQGLDFSKMMLNFCLLFVRLRNGAELLHGAGIFSHLRMLNNQFKEELSFSSGDMEGPFSVFWKNGKQHDGLWGLGVSVVTGLVLSLADKDPGGLVLQNALTYIQLEKDRLLGALRSPSTPLDLQGRKKAKLQRPRTTLSALQETQHVVALLCEVSHHNAQWTCTLKESVSDFGELVVHLLAFIAREGLVRLGSTIRSGTGTGFSCSPVLKDEIVDHTKSPTVGSTCAWFAVTATGCYVESSEPSDSSQSSVRSPSQPRHHSPNRRTSSLSSSPVGGLRASEYSERVAIQIYKLAFLLLRLLCQQAHHAIARVEEGGPPDYLHFPELPAPEILHGLQDQVVAIVTEVCGKPPNKAALEVSRLLLSILEMTLYLEVCIVRTCGVGAQPMRSDDFGKDYKAMLLAGCAHTFLEASFQSLKRIMATAHPALV
ncbi:nuclear pore complex protein Nup188 [Marchantia polymorpha subsp. ruderalis]|uniref:Nucleoporin Nup188 N-terminal subdomain III domain-containing protein n=2 Tax=Marchantia polymorpha TaxID=3197 RepID=A0AAF6ARN0_MARPO|nr:hypothetical protein MARPO_0001s0208 [Marchantia polymorpha]BBM99100.1 hypothetical protein Mp_1g18700 [Marchantia polymorpha subsp. ruderalis]|eukprot:PTQ50177.1 hypothetical protein MARPO_0001s0208 [Marchantia polymorpha]